MNTKTVKLKFPQINPDFDQSFFFLYYKLCMFGNSDKV